MTVVIAAGGTGGHLYPAVALAREFLHREPDTSIVFVGTERGLEGTVLSQEGFALERVAARPVMGRGLAGAAGALLSLPVACWQSVKVLRGRRADLVIGVGGYTSPPVLMAAWLLSIPRVILEPNAVPGMANQALGPLANLVFVAFASAGSHFRSSKVRLAGTPVRRAFFEPTPAHAEGSAPPTLSERGPAGQRLTLLVFGGSQGARAINNAMVEALPHLQGRVRDNGLAVIHQTGGADYERVKAAYDRAGIGHDRAEVVPFLFDMPRALRSADLVVARAGAVTIAELTACGKPAILIPLPSAIYRHQERNAQVLASAGAAVLLLQDQLTGPRLAGEIAALLRDASRLAAMGTRSRAIGRTDSAEVIVGECLALARRRDG